ncbi:MAG: hypothetical protein HY664_08660 [Chloroflexi bacterium]|nr:hypothetical protein [Chloroflexota bacterium]
MTKVGIPRALLYYQFYPMWRTFFSHLGADVVVSAPTTKSVITTGSSRVVSETCLPVKVFCGHVRSLVGQCDYVFIPSVCSLEKGSHNCSKFMGLPDVIKAVVPNCPPILDPDIDLAKGKRGFYLALYHLSRPFTWNPLKVKAASEAAWQSHLTYRDLMHNQGLVPLQALAQMGLEPEPDFHEPGPATMTIAVIGHPYVLFDEYINHKLIRRLQGMGVRVVTAEMAGEEDLALSLKKLAGRAYWTFEDEIVGAGGHYLERNVDGIISVVAFGCGPDSLMIDLLQRQARKVPTKAYMSLTIDEHTAEAGLVTRLEAYVDMIRRRKNSV